MRLTSQKTTINVSEADVVLAVATVDATCFQILRGESTIDATTSSGEFLNLILYALAGIVLMLMMYFLYKRRCKVSDVAEHSTPDIKTSSVSIPISQIPESLRSKLMAKLGGKYFHELILGRRQEANAKSCNIELSSIEKAHVDDSNLSSAPPTAEPVRQAIEVNDQVVTPAQNTQSEECSPRVMRSTESLEMERHESDDLEIESFPGETSGVCWGHSGKKADQTSTLALPKGYQGKKYTIDFENVRPICLVAVIQYV
jgi:hypothetical protein